MEKKAKTTLFVWLFARLSLPLTSSKVLTLEKTQIISTCTVENGLKGQKLLAQGNALGKKAHTTALKGHKHLKNSNAYALTGRFYFAHLPRALPWAVCFCPFRAT